MHLSESASIMNPGNEVSVSVSRGNRRKRLALLGEEGGHVTRRDWRGSESWKFPCTRLLFARTRTHTCSQRIVKDGVLAAAFYFYYLFILWQPTSALHTGHNHKPTLQKWRGTFGYISRRRPDKCEIPAFYHVVSLGESCASISSHSLVVAQQTS